MLTLTVFGIIGEVTDRFSMLIQFLFFFFLDYFLVFIGVFFRDFDGFVGFGFFGFIWFAFIRIDCNFPDFFTVLFQSIFFFLCCWLFILITFRIHRKIPDRFPFLIQRILNFFRRLIALRFFPKRKLSDRFPVLFQNFFFDFIPCILIIFFFLFGPIVIVKIELFDFSTVLMKEFLLLIHHFFFGLVLRVVL